MAHRVRSMNTLGDHAASICIIACALLGAVTVLLVPGLFAQFESGRLVIISILVAISLAFGIAAKRRRRNGTT